MKRIMILGGGANQTGLLQAAKNSGYYVILCDNNPECLNKPKADLFLHINITDKDQLIQAGKIHGIHGIISNSEFAMETVAAVAEALGLVGNPVESIQILQSKYAFRQTQKHLGIFAPGCQLVTSYEAALVALEHLQFPVVVKPVQCSGTRGTTRFDAYEPEKLKEAVEACIVFSRNGQCAIEEFILMPEPMVVEGDVFLADGQYFWDGLFFTIRSEKLPMVPMTYLSPYRNSEAHMAAIKNTIMTLFEGLNMKHGQFNVEGYFDQEEHFFVIEINVRQGGHGLPAYIKLATGVDMDRLLVTTAVGDSAYYHSVLTNPIQQSYAVRHTVFSDACGSYEGIYLDEEIKNYVVAVEEDKKPGDPVEIRKNGSSYCGFVNLVFPTYELQHNYCERIEDYIYPLIKEL